jgi:hypothetical protein
MIGTVAKHSTMQCNSHGRLTPTARHIPRRETRSRNQVGHLRPALGSHEAVCGTGAHLALALVAQMMLFAVAGMAIFLVPC